MEKICTLVDLLEFRAGERPDQTVFSFLENGETVSGELDFAQLAARAKEWAAHLQAMGWEGERALLLFPPGLDFIVAFFACLLAKVVAVPVYPPDPHRLERTLPRLQAIVKDAQAKGVLTLSWIQGLAPQLGELRFVGVDQLGPGSGWKRPEIGPETLAFLQYTSGSTGSPKGVMVSHGNLLANLESVRRCFGLDESSRGVSWLPPYHDMGLIGGILEPVYIGGFSALFSPVDFLKQPIRWLKAITRFKGTSCGGPNFAYELCLKKISEQQKRNLNLSSWDLAFNGAEPIRAATMERFAEAFAPCGFKATAFYPCYGLAEATLMVSGGAKGALPVTRAFQSEALSQKRAVEAGGTHPRQVLVGCGRAVDGEEIVIVDAQSRRSLSEGNIGEIWVRGPSVAQGYWNRPEDTTRTFLCRLADGKEETFLATGDLGFLQNGELFVAGRSKDLIIINGVNHYPQDIEAKLEGRFPELRPGAGAAFSVHENGEERLALVWEVEGSQDDALADRIRSVLSEEMDLSLAGVQFLEAKSLPKTSSGKISRWACREGYLNGTLKIRWQNPQAQEPAAPKQAPAALPEDFKIFTGRDIQSFLQKKIGKYLAVSPSQVDVDKPFGNFGLDSKAALGVAGDLEVFLGRNLPITLMWQYPTIEKLALHLSGEDQRGRVPFLAERREPAEPIAVVGMGCRFPKAKNLESFWQLLREGVNAITVVPKDRWDVEGFYDPDPEAAAKMVTKWGGFLENLDQFDAAFFGISPKEAKKMDPQQRLVLEVAWEALEHGGISPQSIAGSRGGVYLGIAQTDYSTEQMDDPMTVNAYAGTGNAHSIAANRLSYVLDLHGPSVALDTACSSSLVAVHLGIQSLRSGETDLCLAGGVNVILRPEVTIVFSKAKMMSPRGRCAAFDAEADGYVRGEGCGILVLKRLSDALRDGDSIQAVIRGSAVNQDGRSSSLTAPNGLAQQAVVREALSNAGLHPADLSYIEAHGTGTPIGDPIEMNSLGEILGESHTVEKPCLVGSVKTNIGHLEVASGVAGIIKVILALQNQEIPPHLHFKRVNEYIPLDRIPIKVPVGRTPWTGNGKLRRAGVNSFGFGGANAHIVLEEAPPRQGMESEEDRSHHLFKISAGSEESLNDLVGRYRTYLENHSAVSLKDLCYSANLGRGDFEYRLTAVAESVDDLQKSLGDSKVKTGRVRGKQRPQIGFLFTGQGSQYSGMGRFLYEGHQGFRKILNEADALLREQKGFSLLHLLYPKKPEDSETIHETGYTQPALFAMEYALAQLWASWGVRPDFVLGHSVGEYVAAAVAGVFRWEEGLLLIAERGELMQGLSKEGGMIAILGEPAMVGELIGPYQKDLSIAAINGPKNVVVSGRKRALKNLEKELQSRGLATQALVVSHAFHSPMMDPILETFERKAAQLTFHSPQLPLVANLNGRFFGPGEIPDAKYWTEHLRGTVRFFEGMEALAGQACDVMLEVGPQPVLTQLGKRCIPYLKCTWLPSLRRGSEDWKVLQESLADLYLENVAVDWKGVYGDSPGKKLKLPTYSFHKESFWLENIAERSHPFQRGTGAPVGTLVHPVLGAKLEVPLDNFLIFEQQIRLETLPYFKDHRVEEEAIFPAAGFVELALKAAQVYFGKDELTLDELNIHQALILEEKSPVRLQVLVEREIGTEIGFKIFSQRHSTVEGSAWVLHGDGRVRLWEKDGSRPRLVKDSLDEIRGRCPAEIDVPTFYRGLKFQGLNYGPHFQGVQKIWKGPSEAVGMVQLNHPLANEDQYYFPPNLLDSALQVLAGVHADQDSLELKRQIYLPVGFKNLRLEGRPPKTLWSHASFLDKRDSKNIFGHVRLLDPEGKLLGEIEEVIFKPLPGLLSRPQGRQSQVENWNYRIAWEEKPLLPPQGASGRFQGTWLLFEDGQALGENLSRNIQDKGGRVLRIYPGRAFSHSAPGQFTLRPECPQDFEKLLQLSFDADHPHCEGIVHLWGLRSEAEWRNHLENFSKAQELGCHSVLHLIQGLGKNARLSRTRLILVSRGVNCLDEKGSPPNLNQAPLWGLGKVISLENPNMDCLRIDLAAEESPLECSELLNEIFYGDGEDQIVLRNGKRRVPRLLAESGQNQDGEKTGQGKKQCILPEPSNGAYRVGITQAGTLESVEIVPVERQTHLGEGELELEVRAAGLNFSDVLKVLGLYPGLGDGPVPLGIECSGRITRVGSKVKKYQVGDDVITVAPFCFGKYVVSPAEDVMPKPPQLSYEDAATIPIAFLTAYYALVYLGRIQKGERILIHAGAGGVGLAAIQIAKLYQCEIFSTAGSPEKRKFLQDLGVHHVMDSRTLKFAGEIKSLTKGRGVDLVLNSLAGDFIPKSLSILGAYGRFLEIGKIDIYSNSKMGLLPFQDNLSYFAIDLDRLFRQRPAQARQLFAELIGLFMEQKLQPLPHTDFPLAHLSQGLRYMAQRKNIGKIVVVPKASADSASAEEAGKGGLSPQKTYLITGGLGSLGMRVARWLRDQGAKNLILTGRRAPGAEAQVFLEDLQKNGVKVWAAQVDVSDPKEMKVLFQTLQKTWPPLGGVIHAAGVLDDGILEQLDTERFKKVFQPKVDGAWQLHELTQDQTLDFFVLFSSVASVLGSPGQGNYTAANAFLDSLAAYRRRLGLPALSINWGPWAEGGMAGERVENDEFAKRGIRALNSSNGLGLLGQALGSDARQRLIMGADWQALAGSYPNHRVPPLLSKLYQPEGAGKGTLDKVDLMALIRQFKALPEDQRQAWLEAMIQKRVADALDSEPEKVDPEKPLNTMGLDSLMALELKNEIENLLGVVIPITFLIKGPSLRELAEFVVNDMEAMAS